MDEIFQKGTIDTENHVEHKACPFCGETILATAKKCKHCGEWLDVPTNQPMSGSQSINVRPGNRKVTANPPCSKNYIMAFALWIVGLWVAIPSLDAVDYLDSLFFIYIVFGWRKYALYKGMDTTAFSWFIGLEITLSLLNLLGEEEALIGAVICIPAIVLLLIIIKEFKAADEHRMASSIAVYLSVSLALILLYIYIGMEDTDEEDTLNAIMVLQFLIDTCFFGFWCKFFFDAENKHTELSNPSGEPTADIVKKKSFWKHVLESLLNIWMIGIVILIILILVCLLTLD